MRRRSIFALLIALAGGLLAIYIDFHQTEVQPTLLVVLTSGLVAGAIDASFAWLAALIIPACLAAAHSFLPRFGIVPVDAGSLGNPLSLMVLSIPAAISAYTGAALRSAAASPGKHF